MTDPMFEKAFARVLHYEGGDSHHPCDRGGATRFGISQRAYPAVNLQDLSLEKAKMIYYKDYWQPWPYTAIKDAEIACKIFDMAVNTGTKTAHHLAQQGLRAMALPVREDGTLGTQTVDALNRACSRTCLAVMRAKAASHYYYVAQANPAQQCFLKGWLKRAYDE